MSTPSAADLDRLLDLQAVDTSLQRARHGLARLTEQQDLDAAVARRDALVATADDAADRLGVAQREQRRVEGDIAALVQRRDEEHTRLFAGGLSSAREIGAVEAEIVSTERRISEHEDELLGVMERVEALEAEVAAIASTHDSVTEDIDRLTVARDAAAGDLGREIALLEADRAGRAALLPADLVADYEAAAGRGSGVGVGMLADNGCTACGNTLPMKVVSTLLAGPSLTACPQCARLMVIPD